MNAFYIRAADSRTVEALATEKPGAYTEPGKEFFIVELSADEYRCPEAELLALSVRLATDVLWLSFQSTVDAFAYHHWSRGQCVRSLVYGCFEEERTWERAEGTAERWERPAIFSDEVRGYALEDADDPAARQEVERIFRDAVLLPGSTVPHLDARECARKVAQHYRLPGW